MHFFLFAIFMFPITPSTYFLVTTLKIFSSPVQTEKRQYQVYLWWNTAIRAISGKTLKTAVINTNTHIYKMKRKKKDRKKWKQIINK
jgi:heme/copper-type cytochrome/quinol oxidase subunit 3